METITDLKIEKIAMGGMGLGFHENKAIFVPYTAIGDVVDAVIYIEKKDHAFARPVDFKTRGHGVVEIPCEAFQAADPCGGCDWLMVDYPTQLSWKSTLISELFQNICPPENIAPTMPSPLQNHYRNKVYMPVNSQGYGIFARYSHKIIHHTACKNHPPIFDEIATYLIELCQKAKVEAYNEEEHTGTLRHIGIRANRDNTQILIVMVTRSSKLPFSNTIVRAMVERFPAIIGIVQNINREKGNVILGMDEKILYGESFLQDTLSDIRFNIHYRSFWQINTGTMENVLQRIRALMKPSYKVIDGYCGIGAIGLCLANEIAELVGIEEVPEAIENAKQNAVANGIANTRFICGKFEQTLTNVTKDFAADCIILDPPRSGVDENSLWSIRKAAIPRVIYLSCSPMSLARDLKILLTDDKYTLESISSFDMFPNTWHIETLAVLKLNQ